jgi:hypothetical protein
MRFFRHIASEAAAALMLRPAAQSYAFRLITLSAIDWALILVQEIAG